MASLPSSASDTIVTGVVNVVTPDNAMRALQIVNVWQKPALVQVSEKSIKESHPNIIYVLSRTASRNPPHDPHRPMMEDNP